MSHFTLYGTSACHLCDVAGQMLAEARAQGVDHELDKVDIADSDELFERYGLLIPVLRHADGRELRWPFDPAQLRLFLES